MLLSEKIIQRRYNALANDWTPLSRKPCWLSIAIHWARDYVKRNSFGWFHWLVQSLKITPTNHKLYYVLGKSFADDFVGSGYCKCESILCDTIHWGFCRLFFDLFFLDFNYSNMGNPHMWVPHIFFPKFLASDRGRKVCQRRDVQRAESWTSFRCMI